MSAFFIRAAAATVAAASLFALFPLESHASECGRASWYAMTSRTASGERANPNAFHAAHRTLPFGTRIRVENLGNGRSVEVRVNDRGPFVRGRVVDVSKAAAAQLGFISAGTAAVRVTVVGQKPGAGCS
ncbi:septal ring lytic transglycosylase RlpA family protein [Microbaculum marinum]|uniref:Endolytic peptidoglycan transglycosylase RlpA n=1 Tax=Microbaculum marinum TaxID=1764581 RepID=A0AAW9RRY9_9HYPH